MIDIDSKHLKLLERSNHLFNITRKEMEKYKNERKKLLAFTEDKNVDYKEWENFIEYFEQKIYEERISNEW